ncbi:MAG: methylated-DNA--[protein]-cysteine S-methyltransferase [Pelobium sp.]
MKEQEKLNYYRIAEAINFIKANFTQQPSLEEIASSVNMSPFHFQKLFTDWAGVSPKKFLQYISIKHAKQLLQQHQATLFDAAFKTGLSGTGRLHDLFINIEGMTPGEYKNGGENLAIDYGMESTPFGEVLIASTAKGICYMAFAEEYQEAFKLLKAQFPKAIFNENNHEQHQKAVAIFQDDWSEQQKIKLHLRGTDFQLKVWEALLSIPMGKLSTYGKLAQQIQNPNASRAVGTAIGSNPVAFLIPCHRVIQSTGNFGGYMWGNTRKTAIIGWELAQVNEQ